MSLAFESPFSPSPVPSTSDDAVPPFTVSLQPREFLDDFADVEQAIAQEPTIVAHISSAIESPTIILEARKLTAAKYKKVGFITQDEVVGDVIAHDPAHDHSTYYATMNELSDGKTQIIATARKIHWDPTKGDQSFPVWQHKEDLFPEAVAEIETIGLEHCVEVSTLVKDSKLDTTGMAPLELYRSIFQDSLKASVDGHDETVYLMAANPMLFDTFKQNFNGYIKRIGPDLDYPGQPAIPAMIRPRDGIVDALHRLANDEINNDQLKFVINFMLEGLDESAVDPGVVEALSVARAAGVIPAQAQAEQTPLEDASLAMEDDSISQVGLEQLERGEWLRRLKDHLMRRKPEYAAASFLIGYTALRTLGVAHEISPDTDVDWRMFLGIEIATTPTYVVGMGDIGRAIANPGTYSRNRQVGAAVMAGSSFLAPYAYVLAEGEGMPASSAAGVVALLGVSAVSVMRRLRKQRRDSEINTDIA